MDYKEKIAYIVIKSESGYAVPLYTLYREPYMAMHKADELAMVGYAAVVWRVRHIDKRVYENITSYDQVVYSPSPRE